MRESSARWSVVFGLGDHRIKNRIIAFTLHKVSYQACALANIWLASASVSRCYIALRKKLSSIPNFARWIWCYFARWVCVILTETFSAFTPLYCEMNEQQSNSLFSFSKRCFYAPWLHFFFARIWHFSSHFNSILALKYVLPHISGSLIPIQQTAQKTPETSNSVCDGNQSVWMRSQ